MLRYRQSSLTRFGQMYSGRGREHGISCGHPGGSSVAEMIPGTGSGRLKTNIEWVIIVLVSGC